MKHKLSLLILSLMLILSSSVTPVFAAQGTDGDELQVAQPSKLEIQLGQDWSGVGFTLRTDAGQYPDTIPVGEDGVLRLEIGGSSSYILSSVQAGTYPTGEEAASEETEQAEPESETEANVRGIPVKHIIIFGGGILLAGGTLVGFKILGNKPVEYSDNDDEYDDEDNEE